MPDFGIGETIAALLASTEAAGIGAGAAGGAAAFGTAAEAGAGIAAVDAAAAGIGAGAAGGGIGAGLAAGGAGAAGGASAFGAAPGASSGFADTGALATGAGAAGGAVDAGTTLGALGGAAGLDAGLVGSIDPGVLNSLGGGFSTGSGVVSPGVSGPVADLGGFAPPATTGGGAPLPGANPGSIDMTGAFQNPATDVFTGATNATPGASTAPAGVPAVDTTSPAIGGSGTDTSAANLASPGGGFVDSGTALGAPASSPSILSQLGGFVTDAGNALNSPTGKLLSAGVGLAGLGRNLMAGNQTVAGNPQLSALAGTTGAQGTQLQSYLTTGTLPPGVQSSIDQATQDAITAVRSQYAGRGVAPGSTAEVADINRLRQAAVTNGAQIATNLLQAGTSQQQLSANIYQYLLQANTASNKETNAAIANLTYALGGGTNRPAVAA